MVWCVCITAVCRLYCALIGLFIFCLWSTAVNRYRNSIVTHELWYALHCEVLANARLCHTRVRNLAGHTRQCERSARGSASRTFFIILCSSLSAMQEAPWGSICQSFSHCTPSSAISSRGTISNFAGTLMIASYCISPIKTRWHETAVMLATPAAVASAAERLRAFNSSAIMNLKLFHVVAPGPEVWFRANWVASLPMLNESDRWFFDFFEVLGATQLPEWNIDLLHTIKYTCSRSLSTLRSFWCGGVICFTAAPLT